MSEKHVIKVVAATGMPEDAALLLPSGLTPPEALELTRLVDSGEEFYTALATVVRKKAAIIHFAQPKESDPEATP